MSHRFTNRSPSPVLRPLVMAGPVPVHRHHQPSDSAAGYSSHSRFGSQPIVADLAPDKSVHPYAESGDTVVRILPALTRRESTHVSSWHVARRIPIRKRLLDLAVILAASPILLPLMLGIAAFIKLASPGPVFFTQERAGFRERRFRLLKFRSMKVNAETHGHANHTTMLFKSNQPMVKLDSHGDPRHIPFAWILRSTGLDELPQLINVLRGEMSIVGPRPCTEYEFDVLLPWHKRRFDVLPGLTGLWQVSGKNKTTFLQMINFDIKYARDWSVWNDFKIMLRTFPVLFGQLKEMVEKRWPKTPKPSASSKPAPHAAAA